MRQLLNILIFALMVTSCRKEDDLKNSFDSESVTYTELIMYSDTLYDSVICIYSEYSYIRLKIGSGSEKKEFIWTPSNDTTPTIEVNKPGKYSLRMIDHSDSIPDTNYFSITLLEGLEYELYIPNTFTPDGTGWNDTWRPSGGKVEKYNAKVYNRENAVVFNTYNLQQGWKGDLKSNGRVQPNNSVFRYVVKVKFFSRDEVKVYKGYVRVLR